MTRCDCGRYLASAKARQMRCRCGCVVSVEPALATGRPVETGRQNHALPCAHRGPQVGRLDCGCQGNTSIYFCGVHGQCMIRRLKPGKGPAATCNFCADRLPK